MAVGVLRDVGGVFIFAAGFVVAVERAALAAGPLEALGHAKRLLRAEAPLDQQLEDESRTIAAQSINAEGREGIAAFLAKRKPQFST